MISYKKKKKQVPSQWEFFFGILNCPEIKVSTFPEIPFIIYF